MLSDLLYLILYRGIGYRTKVVRANLNLVYPNKNALEKKEIEREFYHHFCDVFLEMIKTLSISEEEMKKRCSYTNIEVLHDLESKGKSVLLLVPHYASWEWILSLNSQIKSQGYAIYLKIQNPYFDQLVRKIRAKFGTALIATYETRQLIKRLIESGETITIGMANDQSPQMSKAKYWSEFMGIRVPIHIGAEELCKVHDIIPIYLKVNKLKRGFYRGSFHIITENPREIPDYGITEQYLRMAENAINEDPRYYFWTHKRWKHRGKEPN